MGNRTIQRPRAVWRTTRTAVLCPALAVLLMALVMCLGYAARATSDVATVSVGTTSAIQMPSHTPAEHHAVAVTHPGDCPAGDVCCAQDTHGVRAVLPGAAQPVPTILPRIPSLPGPAALACSLGLTPTRGAPDLHVLQQQRT